MKLKLDEWVDTIDDVFVQAAIRRDAIVTGGSIVSLLLGERINDFDIYFKTKSTTLMVANYYVNKWNADKTKNNGNWNPPIVRERKETNIRGVVEDIVEIYVTSSGVVQTDEDSSDNYDMFANGQVEESAQEILDKAKVVDSTEEKEPYRVVFMSANAITLSDSIQIITRFYGSPEEIHKNFDFAHATSCYDYKENSLTTPEIALQCILSKTLHYTGSLYPIASVFRAKKFIERGWRISAGELIKMCFQISKLDLSDMKTLKQQLTGVDMMYLHMLVGAIQQWRDASADNVDIDSAYVVEIIDRIFGI